MKLLISLLFMAFFLVSCGDSPKTEAKINLSSVTAAGITMPGGLMFFGYNYDTQKHEAFKFDNGEDSFILDNGLWDFFVLGWDGPQKLEGTPHCGFTKSNLQGGDATIDVSISTTNCNNLGTIGSRFLVNSDFDAASDVFVETCGSLPNGNSTVFADNCTADVGSIGSLQVGLVAVNGILISECKDVTPGSTLPGSIRIPLGRSFFKGFRTQIRAYTQSGCNGPQVDIFMPNGLANDDNFQSANATIDFLSRTDGVDTKIFVKDGFPKPFVSTWTLGTPDTVTLPIVAGYSYNFFVDWGDGGPISHVTSHTDPDKAHTYTAAGSYTVTISGTLLEAWNFNTGNVGSSRDYLVSVSSLGELGWKNLSQSFRNCSNLTSFTSGNSDTSQVTDMSFMFNGATALTTIDVLGMDTSSVVDMTALFKNATSADPNVSGWDTSSLGLTTEMFASTPAANPDLSSWNFAGVVDLNNMFDGTTGIDSTNYTSLLVRLYADIGDPTSMAGDIIDVGGTQYINATAATAKSSISGAGKLMITDGGGI